jgi:hypothetical protein
MSDELVLRGEEPNVLLLAKEIASHPELADVCRVRIATIDEATDDSFGYGPVAEIIITLSSGVATNAAYDLLRRLISRARDRGDLTDRQDKAVQQDKNDAAGVNAQDEKEQQ